MNFKISVLFLSAGLFVTACSAEPAIPIETEDSPNIIQPATPAADPVVSPVSPLSADPAETTTSGSQRIDAYKTDISAGLDTDIQGMWTMQEPRVPADTKPHWFFEGNRITLSYVDDRGDLNARGSDNFRIVDNCVSRNYDVDGRSIDIGGGVFGPDAQAGDFICWTIDRMGPTELGYRVGPESLSLVKTGYRPGDRVIIAAETAGIPMLLGPWRSADDPKSMMIIEPKSVQNFYDGESFGTMPLRMVQTCRDPVTRAQGAAYLEAYIIGEGEAEQCYTVLSITENTMEIAYSGRGNTLRFTRGE